MKEITITFTAEFTNIVTDPQDLALIENNKVSELAKLEEQALRDLANDYDSIKVKSYKVFLNEEDK